MSAITHYQAHVTIERSGIPFTDPLRAPLTDQAVIDLANNGTTPRLVSPELRARADRLKAALLAGRVVTTATAEISPLTATDFKAGRLTPPTGSERI